MKYLIKFEGNDLVLKYSQKKKAKIKKHNQRRINRVCKYMIDCKMDHVEDSTVIDQAKIGGEMYLLTKNKYNQYAIWKSINVNTFIKIAAKKVLRNKVDFMNNEYWDRNSNISIDEYGEIEDVKRGAIDEPYY